MKIEELKKRLAQLMSAKVDDDQLPGLINEFGEVIDALIIARINDALMQQRVTRENPAPYRD